MKFQIGGPVIVLTVAAVVCYLRGQTDSAMLMVLFLIAIELNLIRRELTKEQA